MTTTNSTTATNKTTEPNPCRACEAHWAVELWRCLCEECGVNLMFAGDMRRCQSFVGCIALLAPLCTAADAEDDLVLLGLRRFIAAGHASPIEGIGLDSGAGFRRCRLAVRRPTSRGDRPPVELRVARYEPGNYGLVMLRETGPDDFLRGFYARYRAVARVPEGAHASGDGWLLDAGGVRVETRTEEDAFRAADLAWVFPHQRSGEMFRGAAA